MRFPNKHDCLYSYPDNSKSQASIRWSVLRQHFGKALITFPEVYMDQIKLWGLCGNHCSNSLRSWPVSDTHRRLD